MKNFKCFLIAYCRITVYVCCLLSKQFNVFSVYLVDWLQLFISLNDDIYINILYIVVNELKLQLY